MHILSLGLEKELDSFETSVQMNVSQQLREITCRTCLGLSDKSHGEWSNRGYRCLLASRKRLAERATSDIREFFARQRRV